MSNIKDIENQLVTGPFGDGATLREDYDKLMIEFSEKIGINDSFNKSVRKDPIYNILVNGTILEALSKPTSSRKGYLEKSKYQLNQTIADLQERHSFRKLNTLPINVISLSNDQESYIDLINSRYSENMQKSGLKSSLGSYNISNEDITKIDESIELLLSNIPKLSEDVLNEISTIFLQKSIVESAFISNTPELVYIDLNQFDSREHLSDVLLHESLHHKLLMIRLTKKLFRPNYNDFDGLKLPVPWGGNEFRNFSVGRAMAAAHVYVHLAFLFAAFISQSSEEDFIEDFWVRWKRAMYLIDTLKLPYYQSELGTDGIDFINWLDDIAKKVYQIEIIGKSKAHEFSYH